MNSEKNRVLIVGGGPAGLAAAIALAAKNIPSTVIEKSQWPCDKVCGEGIMPTGVKFLHDFGVSQYFNDDMFRPFRGICYKRQGITAEGDFSSGNGWGVRRLDLSTVLHKRASDFSQIEICHDTKFIEYNRIDNKIYASIKKDRQQNTIGPFSLLIAADGLRSQIRKQAGLEGPSPGKQKRWGARQHFCVEPWSDQVEVWWSDGIEAYVTPSGPKRVQIAFLWDRDQYKPDAKNLFASLIQPFPQLHQKIAGCSTLSEIKGIGPLAVGAKNPIADQIVLLGDAFTYLDGITGEGISISFLQARMVGEFVSSIWPQQNFTYSDLKPLAELIKAETCPQLQMTKFALLFTRFPLLQKLALRALSRSPKGFQHFLEANMGERSVWNFPLAAIPGLLLGIIFPKRDQLWNNKTIIADVRK